MIRKSHIQIFQNQKIILTGHSQGTALAEICAVDLALMFGAQIDLSILNISGVPGGNQGSIFAINPFVLTQ